MKRIFKTALLVFLALSCISLSGCYDSQEIDSDSYVIAIGVDTAEDGFSFTFQFSNPLGIYSDGGGENGSSSTAVICTENFKTAKSLLGSFIGKNVSLSQTKVIVFSYDIAAAGCDDLVRSFLSEREIRPNAYVVVSSTEAEEFLNGVKPELSISEAKYYENLFRDEALKFAPLTKLKTFGETLENSWFDCVVPLAGLAADEDDDFASVNADYTAGSQPRRGGEKTEIIGMAVMKDGKLVGELSGYYAALFKILSGKAKNLPLTFGDTVLEITENPNVLKHVTVYGGFPEISVNVSLTANCENPDAAAKALEEALSELLRKTSREFGTDIFGFGSDYRRKYLTSDDWERAVWSEIYKRAKFDVKVKIN